jgi:hypothetical protein
MSVMALSDNHFNALEFGLFWRLKSHHYCPFELADLDHKEIGQLVDRLRVANHNSYQQRYRVVENLPKREKKEHPLPKGIDGWLALHSLVSCLEYNIEIDHPDKKLLDEIEQWIGRIIIAHCKDQREEISQKYWGLP